MMSLTSPLQAGKRYDMGIAEEIMAELERVAEKMGGKKQFAEWADEDPSLFTRWFKQQRSPGLHKIGPILDRLRWKVSFGEDAYSPEFVFIEKALAKPSAGGGSLQTTGQTEGGLSFKLTWLKSRTTASPKNLKIMEVDGDSMSPTIGHKDVVLVDESEPAKKLKEGKVYVIRKGEEIYVKRYGKGVGELLFMGDNRNLDYQDVRVKPGEEDGFAVIGRVLWTGKEL